MSNPSSTLNNREHNRPLMRWLKGRNYYLKSPTFIAYEDYKLDRAHLVIFEKLPVHKIGEVQLRPFEDTWKQTLEYIVNACDLLEIPRPGRSPSTQQSDAIIAKLGLPPLRCYALYIISVGTGTDERVVYVGQTNSRTHRFKAGHHALTALHAPEYRGLDKHFYLCGFEIEDDDDHVFPIEWIHPPEWRQEVLTSIEGQLIFELQPELNSKNRKTSNPTHDLPIQVHNYVSSLLHRAHFGPEFSERDIEAQLAEKEEASSAQGEGSNVSVQSNDSDH